jgi:hypothetical protein
MQMVGVLLTLLSIVLVAAPVGAVVVIYQNDLTQLVIPPEIHEIINGDSSSLQVNGDYSVEGNYSIDGGDDSFINDLIVPTFVSASIDNDANTFTVVADITNNVKYNFTLNTLTTQVQTTSDHYQLVTVNLSQPVTLVSGQTSRVTIVGSWTQNAEDYFIQNYSGATKISVELINTSIAVNGITVDYPDTITIGDIPLTLEQ